MKRLVVTLASIMLVGACSKPEPKRVKDEYIPIEPYQARINELEQTVERQNKAIADLTQELSHPDCGGVSNKTRTDGGLRYGVTTAKSPEDLIRAVDNDYRADGIETHEEGDRSKFTVKTVHLEPGEHYPDVICLSTGLDWQTCFDPMEITER